MNVIKPMQQGLMSRTFVKDRRFYLSVASLSYFPFHNPQALGTEQEMWQTISDSCYKDMIFDLCMPKSRGEVLVIGKCCAPVGVPASRLFVDFDFGPIYKRVVVTGNRYWKRGTAGENLLLRAIGNDWTALKTALSAVCKVQASTVKGVTLSDKLVIAVSDELSLNVGASEKVNIGAFAEQNLSKKLTFTLGASNTMNVGSHKSRTTSCKAYSTLAKMKMKSAMTTMAADYMEHCATMAKYKCNMIMFM